MSVKNASAAAATAIKSHPWRTAAVCVLVFAASAVTGASVASARPEPTLAVSAAELHAVPTAHIFYFGADPVKPVTDLKPGAVEVQVPHADGCDPDYGTPDLCVPWTIPGSTPAAKCDWLYSMGFGPLKVYGVNRQHLPEDSQGYVCAKGT